MQRLDVAVNSAEGLLQDVRIRDSQIKAQKLLLEKELEVCRTDFEMKRSQCVKEQKKKQQGWEHELAALEEQHRKIASLWKKQIREAKTERDKKHQESESGPKVKAYILEWDKHRMELEETAKKVREDQLRAKVELDVSLKSSRAYFIEEQTVFHKKKSFMQRMPIQILQEEVQELSKTYAQKKSEADQAKADEQRKTREVEEKTKKIRAEIEEAKAKLDALEVRTRGIRARFTDFCF